MDLYIDHEEDMMEDDDDSEFEDSDCEDIGDSECDVDMDDFDNCITHKDHVGRLRRLRNRVRVPDSLQVIVMKAVLAKRSYFMNLGPADNRVNPFKNMPDDIVQKIIQQFSDANAAKNEDCEDIPEQLSKNETAFLCLLLNSNITVFNCDNFMPNSTPEEDIFFQHMQKNCPNMKKLIKERRLTRKYTTLRHEVPVTELAKWKNLTCFYMRNYFCTDSTMEKIAELMPNLQGMHVQISTESFTMKGVGHLSKLLKLEEFFTNVEHKENGLDANELIAHAAGKSPSLQRLKFCNLWNDSSFVKAYGKFYPGKKLHVMSELSLNKDFQVDCWPPGLFVNQLAFSGELSQKNVDSICTIDFPLMSLEFTHVPGARVHQIVEKLGSSITTLKFIYDEGFEAVDMFRVLVACPKVDSLTVLIANKSKKFRHNLIGTPDFFKNYKNLTFNASGKVHLDMEKIFAMFVKGTEKCTKLYVYGRHLREFREVLDRKKGHLNKLVELEMEITNEDQLYFAIDIADDLAYHSPYLQKVKFHLDEEYDPSFISQEVHEIYDSCKKLYDDVGIELKLVNRGCTNVARFLESGGRRNDVCVPF